MPFTVAHPAAVLPLIGLRSRWLCATSLVAGSVAPDFEYFLHGRMMGSFAHTVRGLFLFDVPVALLTALVFHVVIRDPLLLALPRCISDRWSATREPPASRTLVLFVAPFSALLGAATHLIWDSATHHGGWIVERVASLRRPFQLPILGAMDGYRVVQHGSTVIGLLVLIVAFAYWLRAGRATRVEPVRLFTAAVLTVGTLGCSAAFLWFRMHAEGPIELANLGHYVVSVITGGLVGLVGASALLNLPARAYAARVTGGRTSTDPRTPSNP